MQFMFVCNLPLKCPPYQHSHLCVFYSHYVCMHCISTLNNKKYCIWHMGHLIKTKKTTIKIKNNNKNNIMGWQAIEPKNSLFQTSLQWGDVLTERLTTQHTYEDNASQEKRKPKENKTQQNVLWSYDDNDVLIKFRKQFVEKVIF